ncbi:hypothetical protein AB0M39_40105 [Streptomyces sp. NPDC051907]|uniref:hypothetical protein n=1 Tax=Streptomyces sp. NPDC051907 TaxID=3155284 RepID=UPI003426C8A0
MAGEKSFGVLLERLADRRRLDLTDLARLVDVSESELLALYRRGTPGQSLLRRLAPSLGLHTADVFAIAGGEVPADLAPVDTEAGLHVPYLLKHAVALSPEQRGALRQFVASLPQKEHVQPVPSPPAYEQYPDGPGAVLMRLARTRNLSWSALAKTFYWVTGRYWAAATYGGVGRGTTPLTPELLADFSAVLDIPAADLTLLTGVALPDESSATESAVAGLAELIWDVRHLTESQLLQAIDVAESLRR